MIETFETVLQNATHAEIAPILETWGYDETARTADLELLAQVRAAYAAQQRESAQADVAHKAEASAESAVRAGFTILHRFTRFAARRNPDLNIISTLNVQPVPKPEQAFLNYADGLLERIADQPAIAAALAELRQDEEKLDELRGLLDAMRQANAVQAKEQGEAERATAAYSALLNQVRAAYDYIKLISKEALKDDLQLVEIMGLGKV